VCTLSRIGERGRDVNAKSNEVMTAAMNTARNRAERKRDLGTVDRLEIDFRAAMSQGN